jgi:hypothetical protein
MIGSISKKTVAKTIATLKIRSIGRGRRPTAAYRSLRVEVEKRNFLAATERRAAISRLRLTCKTSESEICEFSMLSVKKTLPAEERMMNQSLHEVEDI